MTIGTGPSSALPQMSAAYVNASCRCWPSVTPALPPTGFAGVVSLKPTPGGSRLLITSVALADAARGIANSAIPIANRPAANVADVREPGRFIAGLRAGEPRQGATHP